MNKKQTSMSIAIKWTAIVIGILYLVAALYKIPAVFTSLFGISRIFVRIMQFLFRIIYLIPPLVFGSGMLLFGLRRKRKKNTNSLFLLVIVCAVANICINIIAALLWGLVTLAAYGYFSIAIVSKILGAMLVILCTVAVYVLLILDADQPFVGMSGETFKKMLYRLPAIVKREVKGAADDAGLQDVAQDIKKEAGKAKEELEKQKQEFEKENEKPGEDSSET